MASPRVRKPEIHEVKTTGSLCDANSGYGALRCNPYGGCPGANGSNCNPYNVWSGTLKSGTNYYDGNLNSGTFNATTSNYNAYTNAFSVRCVLDLEYRQQLCDEYSGYGALQCQNYSGCPGAYNSNCYPNCVWSGTFISTDRYDYRCLGNDGFASYTQPSNQGLGVRCVLGFETIKFKRYLHFCHIFSFSSIIGIGN